MLYHHHSFMDVQDVLLDSLTVLLDLIKRPNHAVIVMDVAKCVIHANQKFSHGDISSLWQPACPFAWVALQTCEDVGSHAGLIILVQPALYIKPPQLLGNICIRISGLEYWHPCRGKVLFILPPSPSMPASHGLTCS